MILSPAVIALMLGSAAVGLLALYASAWGVRILRHWDLRSGSESQLQLEKRTYLVSTLMAWAFAFQVGSLFLFIFTAEDLHRLFVGAMCAAGTLNVNEFGYPTILLKVGNALLAGIWLIVNYTDNRASDYPLIRKKYALLLVVTPLLLLETFLQGAYFAGLKANVITSCCGSLFGAEAQGPVSLLVGLPARPMQAALIASLAITFASGLLFLSGRAWAGALFACLEPGRIFRFRRRPCVLRFPLHLRTADPSLPLLHLAEGILVHRVLHLRIPAREGPSPGRPWALLLPFRGIESLQGALPPVLRRLVLASLFFYLLLSRSSWSSASSFPVSPWRRAEMAHVSSGLRRGDPVLHLCSHRRVEDDLYRFYPGRVARRDARKHESPVPRNRDFRSRTGGGILLVINRDRA